MTFDFRRMFRCCRRSHPASSWPSIITVMALPRTGLMACFSVHRSTRVESMGCPNGAFDTIWFEVCLCVIPIGKLNATAQNERDQIIRRTIFSFRPSENIFFSLHRTLFPIGYLALSRCVLPPLIKTNHISIFFGSATFQEFRLVLFFAFIPCSICF